ncbi:alpha-hydroxy-acid oxidizing protein [Streptomyces sp. TRM68367]|nr:alpha-hydroxy-acid oxidizing protein [Streptomyces sp. TRM68367]
MSAGVSRHLPRLREIRPLLRLRMPRVSRRSRLERAATIEDLRALARTRTPRAVFDYVDGAAESEVSAARALESFARVEFLPRVLRGLETPDLSTSLLGSGSSLPVILAPAGFTRMMHHDGELAAAAAAAEAGIPYVLSTLGTMPPERIAVPASDRWFQVYLWKDRAVTRALVDRAAKNGFRALVLTVDTPVAGARLRDARNGFSIPPALTARTLLDLARHPAWWWNVLTTEPLTFASLTSTEGEPAAMVNRIFNPGARLEDLEWLRRIWDGPLVVKGVLSAQEASRVVSAGADAVIVSNHGGRQLDRAATPLEALGEVVQAVGSQAEVYMDGGVRSGADVAAAVGLGARACLIGRSYLFGLMAGGRPGVQRALDILRTELSRTMSLAGAGRLDELAEGVGRLRR